MSDKIDYSQYGHFFVRLEDEQSIYYATCNVHYFCDFDGVIPSPGTIHVYLMDPKRGSVVTRLELDAENDMYVVEDGYPALDSLQIDTISEAYKEYIKNIGNV